MLYFRGNIFLLREKKYPNTGFIFGFEGVSVYMQQWLTTSIGTHGIIPVSQSTETKIFIFYMVGEVGYQEVPRRSPL